MKQQNSEPCMACGSTVGKNGSSYELSDRRKGLTGKWRLITCQFCSVISMDPMPTNVQLGEYYKDYIGARCIDFRLKSGSRHPWLRKLFHLLSGDVDPRDFIHAPNGARILDYGCGNVGYLLDFGRRGFNISGAEISSNVVAQCRDNKIDVRQVTNLSKIPFADEEFDIVYLMQVFEHLRDPNLFMKELYRVLKPGGLLYLSVPNIDSIWRKIFGSNWVSGWFAPFHLFHYSEKTLKILANRNGFDAVDSWSSTPESWFRLNICAFLYPSVNKLDQISSRLSILPIRIMLMFLLRIFETTTQNRDCLVIVLRKR